MPSLAELAEEGDSILTTDTTGTSGTVVKHTKMGRPATKGKKTRAKRGEPTEVVHAEPEDSNVEIVIPAPKKTRRSRQKSEHLEDIIERPPPKKRSTRTRGAEPKVEVDSAPKRTRGSKRKSEHIEDNIELLPPKKRAPRAREAELMIEIEDSAPIEDRGGKRNGDDMDEDTELLPPEEETQRAQAAELRVEM